MSAAPITDVDDRVGSGLRVALGVLGAVITLALILATAFAFLDAASRHSFQTMATYHGLRSVTVNDEAGDISLTAAGPGTPMTVIETTTEGFFAPSVRSHITGAHGLVLEAKCPNSLECGLDYTLAVPPGLAVRASTDRGAITASGLTASSIQLTSGTGSVTATRVQAPSVRLHSGLGNVRAQLAAAARGLVATSSTGNVSLSVPNTTYAVDARSDVGSVSDSGLTTIPGALRSIRAHSNLGDVTISVQR